MLVLQSITSRFLTGSWSAQALFSMAAEPTNPSSKSLPDSAKTEPDNVTPPEQARFQDEDDEIFDNYPEVTSNESTEEERKKFDQYCLSFMLLGRDVTQHILEFSTTYDLCARVRGVNRDMQSIVSTSNGWFARRLMPGRGVADCFQVVGVMMHTYIYGRDIHEKVLRMDLWGRDVGDAIFFGCATRLWSYQGGATTTRFGIFPTMHEVVITWCHGLEVLSRQLFRLLLIRLGMDEKNLSAKDRRKLRKMYLGYQKKLREDGLRMIDLDAQSPVSPDGRPFDWRWLDSMESADGLSKPNDTTYPICCVYSESEKIGPQRIDPLVMMGGLRNREMSRRFCRLFVDFDGNTPISHDDLMDVRACLKHYTMDMVKLGQEEDIPFVQALMTNVRSESRVVFSPALVARLCAKSVRKVYVRRRIWNMNSFCGYDMDEALDTTFAQQKLLFARTILPMCLSRIGEGAVRADPKFSKTLQTLELDGDEDDELKQALKELFWSCF